jgi:hypothetical protein
MNTVRGLTFEELVQDLSLEEDVRQRLFAGRIDREGNFAEAATAFAEAFEELPEVERALRELRENPSAPEPPRRRLESPIGNTRISGRHDFGDYDKSTILRYRELVNSIGIVPFAQWQRRARALMATHQNFAERTGDAELLQRTGGGLASSLLETTSKYRLAGLQFAEELILECLRWKPFSGVHWTLWANVYFVSGDVQSAGLILWESLKRLPYDPFNASTLAEILSRFDNLEMGASKMQ